MAVGVCLFIDDESGCFYVGATADSEAWVYNVVMKLKSGCHRCTRLQEFWNPKKNFRLEMYLTDSYARAKVFRKEILFQQKDNPLLLNSNGQRGDLSNFKGKQYIPQKGVGLSEATKQKIRDSARGSKPVKINGFWFPSMKAASRETGVQVPTLKKRIRSTSPKFSNYQYAEEKVDGPELANPSTTT